MTRHPYGQDELDRHDPVLDDVASRLEAHAAERGGEPSVDLRARIRAAIEAEPGPARGWWGTLLAGPTTWAPAVRGLAVAGIAAAAVVGAVGLASLMDGFRSVGESAPPIVSPTAEPTLTSSPSPTPTISPTAPPSPTPSIAPTIAPSPISAPTSGLATPGPTASDDDDDDDDETPEPSESESSEPGGGDD